MNNAFLSTRHVHQQDETLYSTYGASRKQAWSLHPESLFNMAVYDVDSGAAFPQVLRSLEPLPLHSPSDGGAVFHPVDKYKDLSLKELLELSDDYLFGDDEASQASVSLLDPTPLNIPDCQTVAQVTGQGYVIPEQVPSHYTENVTSMTINIPTPVTSLGGETSTGEFSLNVSDQGTSKKRPREDFDSFDDEDDEANLDGRFRPYQTGQWSERFRDLVEYQKRTGHCLVPHTYTENLPLARWVKRQRYQYKLMIEGKSSTMTEERVRALEDIGFIWDSQGSAWAERLEELRDFKRIYAHCNVPSNYVDNPQLATWVKCQRRQYKLYVEGKPSNMTPQRIRELESIGFEWLLRSYKKARNSSEN